MFGRKFLILLLCSTVGLGSGSAAHAQGAEAFVGGLLGGAIGTAITNQQQQRRQQPVVVRERTVVRRAPAVNTYQREENRRVQTALNYFGFPAGVADGALGPNSRAAIGQFQAHMGYPPSGYLSDYEKSFLLSSYDRAIVGGPQVATMMAASGQGTRGLLQAFRQEQMGVPPVVAAAPQAAVPQVVVPEPVEAAPPPVVAPVATPEPDPVVTAAAPEQAAPAGQLPSFLAGAAGQSMASHCNRISLSTSSNGGYVTVANLDDPVLALGEQFCLARNYAIEQGESLAVTVQGLSMGEMQAQCEGFAPAMFEYQARLVSQTPAQAAVALQEFVVETGAPPAQLSGDARICLGISYRTDNAQAAVAWAMVLVGLGEASYAELLGHHLLNGFGTPKRPDRGAEWIEIAAGALDTGAGPLVTTGGEARPDLLRRATLALTGRADEPIVQDAAAPAVPRFGLTVPKPAAN